MSASYPDALYTVLYPDANWLIVSLVVDIVFEFIKKIRGPTLGQTLNYTLRIQKWTMHEFYPQGACRHTIWENDKQRWE